MWKCLDYTQLTLIKLKVSTCLFFKRFTFKLICISMCPYVHGSPRSPEADIRHSGAGVIDCIEKQIWLLRTKIRFSRGAANILNYDSLLFLIYSI